jgi:phage-related protein
MMDDPVAKPLFWIASSRRDMRSMPSSVRRSFGYDLFAVQCGETPPSAKILKSFGGSGVLELIEDDRSGTYRAVYTVHFRGAVYALHVFQKKSKRGIATPTHEIGLIRERLKLAEKDYSIRKEEFDQ